MLNALLHPNKKAFLATVAFAVFGILGWLTKVTDPLSSAPLLLYYLLLLVNTYFSIRFFAVITPVEKISQHTADILLGLCILLMSMNLNNALWFFMWATLLFMLATVKYALLLGAIPHPRLLKRKILVDLSGIVASAFALLGALFGYPSASAWVYTFLYLLANIYLMIVNPLYRLLDNIEESRRNANIDG
ncbi:MAG: hypothetical protein UW30_C0002G0051 [Candidatus Giovannonibacteria bacterium GW2011_GWA2_44_13b]|uniref:Uncharacterized protein n=2 Tax=Candidatus Giovannoniibacteriota TaxID=1752738 RepID=A0A0G1H5T6_9BACT|nr:MAG: hypothetical protein UW30_C0002G0051 [Candidatus Giovannonibacteria bacterium GW2011_GWA2_44_13b]OGF81609.1 MAG: hypothetical protein A2924_02590 [Candidatus Giovannonibacteria bacterium RIFCSPLOWO2_01_FULL_44_16]